MAGAGRQVQVAYDEASCDAGPRAPSEHIDWFEDNISWYAEIDPHRLDSDVPSCPGWIVQDVVNHLSFGLGVAYPSAMSKPPDADPEHVFADVAWPSEYPTGLAALDAFTTNMRRCAESFHAVPPKHPCWTYNGPGTASFWFRRAAIETSLHRIDVGEALAVETRHLDDRRARDAIAETLEFALPLASDMTRRPGGRIVVDSPCLHSPLSLGGGDRTATLEGEPHSVLCALCSLGASS